MKKLAYLLLFSFIMISTVNAQMNNGSDSGDDKVSLGLGLGFDHGGYGVNLLVYPQKNIGLFFGGGYALAGFGYNGGIKLRHIPSRINARVNPYFTAMYGYNAVVYVANSPDLNKFFYGPTIGFGLDFRIREGRRGYWTLGALIPIRSTDVQEYIDDLENNHGAEFQNDLMPFGISCGYRIVF